MIDMEKLLKQQKRNLIPERFVPEVKVCSEPSIERYMHGCRCKDCCYIAETYKQKFGRK